jgi:uncharacterized membrane protein YphA (DoxX/SURF4 family)
MKGSHKTTDIIADEGSDKNLNATSSPGLFRFKGLILWTPRILAGAIGLILLISGLLKATDMDLFIRQIKDYGIISHHSLLVLNARGVILAEFTLGTALIVSYRPRWTIPLTVLLLLIFLGATAWAWAMGTTEDCGCFGSWVKRSPGEAIIEDMIMLAALIPYWFCQGNSAKIGGYLKLLSIIIAFVMGLMLPILFAFPIFRISAPLKKSIDIQQVCPEIQNVLKIDLKHGTYLLLLISADCLHCQQSVGELNIWTEKTCLPKLIALSPDDTEKTQAFIKEFKPVYPIVQITEDAFWNLLGNGSTPHLILLSNLEILKVWDEKIPDIDSVREAMK